MKRKIMAIILTLAVMLTVIPLVEEVSANTMVEPFSMGDVNGDGQVTVQDAIQILRYLVGLPSVLNGQQPFPQGVTGTTADALRAAVIVKLGATAPEVGDAIQILRSLVGLPNLIDATSAPMQDSDFYRVENDKLIIMRNGFYGFSLPMGDIANFYIENGESRPDGFASLWGAIRHEFNVGDVIDFSVTLREHNWNTMRLIYSETYVKNAYTYDDEGNRTEYLAEGAREFIVRLELPNLSTLTQADFFTVDSDGFLTIARDGYWAFYKRGDSWNTGISSFYLEDGIFRVDGLPYSRTFYFTAGSVVQLTTEITDEHSGGNFVITYDSVEFYMCLDMYDKHSLFEPIGTSSDFREFTIHR